MGAPFSGSPSCLIRSWRVGVLGTMKTNPVSKPKPLPFPRPSQAVLPLESEERPQRIPDLSRTKCVQLLRELLESVVLQANSNHGGGDE